MEIKIKNNWKAVTIADFHKLNQILHTKYDDDDDLQQQLEIASVLTNIDTETLQNIPYKDLLNIFNNSLFIGYSKPEGEILKTYNINNKLYNATLNLNKMSAGAFMDYMNHLKNQREIEYLLSTVLIPQGYEYGNYDIIDVIEEIKNNFNIADASTLAAFFLTLYKSYLKVSLIYLKKQLKKKMKKKKTTSQEEILKIMETMDQIHFLLNGGGFII